MEAALTKEAHAQAICFATNDIWEGLKSITEKRQPAFKDYK